LRRLEVSRALAEPAHLLGGVVALDLIERADRACERGRDEGSRGAAHVLRGTTCALDAALDGRARGLDGPLDARLQVLVAQLTGLMPGSLQHLARVPQYDAVLVEELVGVLAQTAEFAAALA